MNPDEFEFDAAKVRRSFSRAASSYDAAAMLQQEVATRALQRLDYIKLDPGWILDVGAGTGYCSELLLKRYGVADLLALDFAEGMLHRARKRGRLFRRPRPVCADALQLPVPDNFAQLMFSSLMLQWCHPLEAYFREFHRVLAPGGLLMFTTFGPDTLRELRQAWARIDDGVHVHGFLDMHDVGDALMRAGFSEPVVDVERITVTYEQLPALLRDLKAIGATNSVEQRTQGLTGREVFRRLAEEYEVFRDIEGHLPVTYEVIFGHAWVGDVRDSLVQGEVIPIYPVK